MFRNDEEIYSHLFSNKRNNNDSNSDNDEIPPDESND